ncbi:MAG: endonuclease/exonuclease/phosphatase family protein [Pseudomonadales bacterium]
MRIATFNLENLDDGPDINPSLADRIRIMRPQLERINADILCLQEIHAQDGQNGRTLAALDALLEGTQYANGYQLRTTETTGGDLYRFRNLVTLSRLEITDTQIRRDSDAGRPTYQFVTANPPDTNADPIGWERPMLHTQIDLGGNRTLHVINLHMKSKIATDVAGQKIDNFTWRSVSAWAEGSFVSSMKRVGQALQVRMLIDDIIDADGDDALIVVLGDFNATCDEVPVRAIIGPVEETGNPAHASRIMIPCENNIPDSARFSLYHLGKGEMIDHIIASRAFFRSFQHAEVHNEALPDESGAFRTDVKFPESDHAAVIAQFEI